jgi:hypothetical protein
MKIVISLIILATAIGAFGQNNPGSQPYGKDNPGPVDAQGQSEWVKRLVNASIAGSPESARIEHGGTYSGVARLSASKDTKNRLKVDVSDRIAYKGILDEKNTGILRLLPQIDCLTASKGEMPKCLAKRQELSFFANSYSFQREAYTGPDYGDISLVDGNLDAFQSNRQVLLANLGDLPLSDVTLNSESVRYINAFQPNANLGNAQNQFDEIRKGIRNGGVVYSKNVAANVGDTVVVRSIAYPVNGFAATKDADRVVVMKIVKKDADGALTLVWKELARQDPPAVAQR